MPEFLAETYAARGAADLMARRGAEAALAARQVSQPGAPVRFLGAITVPEEEICFWLYQAPSAGAVRAAMTLAGLRPDRITPDISIRPPEPGRPGRSVPRRPRPATNRKEGQAQ